MAECMTWGDMDRQRSRKSLQHKDQALEMVAGSCRKPLPSLEKGGGAFIRIEGEVPVCCEPDKTFPAEAGKQNEHWSVCLEAQTGRGERKKLSATSAT